MAHFPNLLEDLQRVADESEVSEEISHPLVTRSIQKAQLEIEKESLGNQDADSAKEWLMRNTRRR